ncbi:hypothetical protein SAMN02910400_01256 [Lachnospiraceae bacterium C10]|jgi:hypothetical protein|nr:hypothetical protein SAMN02910400_01256 [Lachnospiraceae bacterium C10]
MDKVYNLNREATMGTNLNITNNVYLRSLYRGNADLSKKDARKEAKKEAVAFADTNALVRGAKVLTSQAYSGDDRLDSKASKAKFYLQMKSFSDAYNYTMDSADQLGTVDAKKALKEMKSLRKDYKDELEELGVTFDEKGYMNLSSSAFDNIDKEEFEEMFGEDSQFLKELTKISKKLNRHIDYQA